MMGNRHLFKSSNAPRSVLYGPVGQAAKFALIALLIVATLSSTSSWAQVQSPPTPPTANGTEKSGKSSSGPRKQLATIVFAGLGGAVLGLSTLSFYGRPQDNLRNIAIGAAFGVIGGTILVTYKAATNPAELYGEQRRIEYELEATSKAGQALVVASSPSAPRFDFTFTF